MKEIFHICKNRIGSKETAVGAPESGCRRIGKGRNMEGTRFEQKILEIEDTLREMWNHTDDDWFQSRISDVSIAMDTLRELYDDAFKVKAGEEDEEEEEEEGEDADEAEEEARKEAAAAALREKEEFTLHYTLLVGLADQFTALGRKRPESACNAFKAQQVNRVLLPLKALTEEDVDLVSEEGEQSYSDVSLLLRGYMDLCSHYARRRYGLMFDLRGHEIPSGGYGYGHR